MVEAGGRDGTADEALIKFYSYVAKQKIGVHIVLLAIRFWVYLRGPWM